MASYSTSEFRKGLKVQIDGDPYLMIECNFVKPGKGQALYKCKLKNLVRNTVLDRTYKSGDSLDAADVEEIEAQYLYRQGDTFVFMDNNTFEQYELSMDQVDDAWTFLKEGMNCGMVLCNNNPITVTPPKHSPPERLVLRVRHPDGAPIQSVRVNGAFHESFDAMRDTIQLDSRLDTIRVRVEY